MGDLLVTRAAIRAGDVGAAGPSSGSGAAGGGGADVGVGSGTAVGGIRAVGLPLARQRANRHATVSRLGCRAGDAYLQGLTTRDYVGKR